MRTVWALTAIICVGLSTAAAAARDEAVADAVPILTVAELAFGSGYDSEALALVGQSERFVAGIEKIWCRTRILGAEAPTTVTHVWYRNGKTVAHVELTVGSRDWRTVSSKRLLPKWTGTWEVRVIDSAGTLLKSASFIVE